MTLKKRSMGCVVSALVAGLALVAPTAGSAQFLPNYQTTNRAKGIGEMS